MPKATRAYARRASRSLVLTVAPGLVVLIVGYWNWTLAFMLHAAVAIPACAGWLFASKGIWALSRQEAPTVTPEDARSLHRIGWVLCVLGALILGGLIALPGNGWLRADAAAWTSGALMVAALGFRSAAQDAARPDTPR